MRLAILTSVMVIFGSAAHAGSIQSVVSANKLTPSQTQVICEGCPPAPVMKKIDVSSDDVKWKPSDEAIDIKEVNGVKKRFSKEAWFGGSPVTFVTTVPGEKPLDAAAVQPLPGVDPAAKTSALTDIKTVDPMKAEVTPAPADAPAATDVAATPADTDVAAAPVDASVAKPKPMIPRLKDKPEATNMDAMDKPEADKATGAQNAPKTEDQSTMQMDPASPQQDVDNMKLRVN